MLEARRGIEHIGQLQGETGVEFEFYGLRKLLNATPTRRRVDQAFGTANDGDFAVPALVKVLECLAAAGFVVDHDGADAIARQLPADGGGGDLTFVQVGEDVNIDEEPVGNDDQAVDVAFEEHLQVAFEAVALVVSVGKDRQIGERVKGVFDATQNWNAKRVGHIEQHHANALAALAAQETRHSVWAVTEAL